MAYRCRIYYNAEQKAEMWDRWQRVFQQNKSVAATRIYFLSARFTP